MIRLSVVVTDKSVGARYLIPYKYVSYFTFTFTLYIFPVVRSFNVIVAAPFFRPLMVPFEDTFTKFLLDVVNFKISGSKYPFFR